MTQEQQDIRCKIFLKPSALSDVETSGAASSFNGLAGLGQCKAQICGLLSRNGAAYAVHGVTVTKDQRPTIEFALDKKDAGVIDTVQKLSFVDSLERSDIVVRKHDSLSLDK